MAGFAASIDQLRSLFAQDLVSAEANLLSFRFPRFGPFLVMVPKGGRLISGSVGHSANTPWFFPWAFVFSFCRSLVVSQARSPFLWAGGSISGKRGNPTQRRPCFLCFRWGKLPLTTGSTKSALFATAGLGPRFGQTSSVSCSLMKVMFLFLQPPDIWRLPPGKSA